jgi:four helix bundle protein
MKEENKIVNTSKAFALRIIGLYKYLTSEKKEYVLSKQILRSGTSIGANVQESQDAQSSADFISKLSIALKEAKETRYWLELLHESDYISDEYFSSLYTDNRILIGTLVKIIKTIKEKQNNGK